MYCKVFLLFILISFNLYAQDSFKNAFDIARSGANYQSKRLSIIAENVANIDSVGSKPGSDPYLRKNIISKNIFDAKRKLYRVKSYELQSMKNNFLWKYDPYNPVADDKGYIKIPNVNLELEKANSLEATRMYEANLSVMDNVKQMMERTIDAMRY